MSTPEWLRPISERYLDAATGPAPPVVRAAAALAAVNAATSLAMIAIWAPMTWRVLAGSPLPVVPLFLTASLTVTGTVLFAVLAPSPVMILRRGWYRPPVLTGLVLGGLALLGLCVAVEPPNLGGDRLSPDYPTAGAVLPWLAGAALPAFAMVGLLRTGSASGWLAQRRYQWRSRADRPVTATVPARRAASG